MDTIDKFLFPFRSNWEEVAKRGLSCLSKPYLSPVPKHPKKISPTIPGGPYSRTNDPHPGFNYSSEELDRPSPPRSTLVEGPTEPESKRNIFKHVGGLFKSLLCKKVKTTQLTSDQKSQALRPLLLPSIVLSEHSASLPPPPPPAVHPAEETSTLQNPRFSDTELVPPRPRRHLPAFAGSGFRSPPASPLSRANSYVPRKASPLQKSHSLPSPPSLPRIEVSHASTSAEKETTKSVSLLRTSTSSSPRGSAFERFKSWAKRLSRVSEDLRPDSSRKKGKGKMQADGVDGDDDDDWDFKCKGDPDDPLTRRTIVVEG